MPPTELEELAADAGVGDLPSQVTAPRSPPGWEPTARCARAPEAELWFDSHHLQLFDAESGREPAGPHRHRQRLRAGATRLKQRFHAKLT